MRASTSFFATLLGLAFISGSRTGAAELSPSDSPIPDRLILTPSPPRDATIRTRVFLDGYEVLPTELDRPLDVRGKGHSLVVKPIDDRNGAPAGDDWTATVDVEGLERQIVPAPKVTGFRTEWLVATIVCSALGTAFTGAAIANYAGTPRRDHVAFFAVGASLHIGAIGPGIVAFIPEMSWSLTPPRGMRDDGGGR